LTSGPVPAPTPDTLPFWQAAKEGRLVIQQCRSCERPFFYPRSGCPRCGGTDLEWREVSGRGRLLSYVIDHSPLPPTKPDERPIIAIVELEAGFRMMTNIVGCAPDPAALPLGSVVEVGFEPRGDWKLPVFRLAGPR
jgi:uncharacterized OB-fold protein